MVREIMTDAEIALAERVAAKRAGRKPTKSTMVRYERPWNAPTSPAPVTTPAATSAPVVSTPTPVRASGGLFIEDRPRGDRLVYVLITQLAERDTDAATVARAWYDRNRETLTVAQGSDWIHRLRAKIATYEVMPVAEPTPDLHSWAQWRELAAPLAALGGRYGARFAVDTDDGATNRIAFWWISPAKTSGHFYLRQIIGGSGPVRVRMSPEAQITVARKIMAAGPVAAMHRYGRELGECGHCGRTLTNDESRAIGIGPWCRTHN